MGLWLSGISWGIHEAEDTQRVAWPTERNITPFSPAIAGPNFSGTHTPCHKVVDLFTQPDDQ